MNAWAIHTFESSILCVRTLRYKCDTTRRDIGPHERRLQPSLLMNSQADNAIHASAQGLLLYSLNVLEKCLTQLLLGHCNKKEVGLTGNSY